MPLWEKKKKKKNFGGRDWGSEWRRGRKSESTPSCPRERRGIQALLVIVWLSFSSLRVLGGEAAISADPHVLRWNWLLFCCCCSPCCSQIALSSLLCWVFILVMFVFFFYIYIVHQWLLCIVCARAHICMMGCVDRNKAQTAVKQGGHRTAAVVDQMADGGRCPSSSLTPSAWTFPLCCV